MVDEYGPRVWSYVARVSGADAATVADTVQEVFLAAASRLSSYRPEDGALVAWLLGIAHRQTALHWRRQERRQRLKRAAEEGGTLALLQDLQVTETERRETADAVRLVVARMPEQPAALLIGRYLEERSTAELAKDFGITEQAVRSRLVRARERFRELFAAAYHDLVPL